MERLLRLLEAIIVRYQLIGGGRTGKLEIECARLAEAIFNGQIVDKDGVRTISNTSDVFQECHDIYPSDPTFEGEFTLARESNNQKAVYLLRKLEQEKLRREQQAKAQENELGAVTLEHVLQTRRQNGTTLLRVIPLCVRFTYRLGNMCLLIAGENRGVGRAAFDAKKAVYGASTIGLTNGIAPIPFVGPHSDRG